MSAIAQDICTIWRKTAQGFSKAVWLNCRAEYALGSEEAVVGANPESTLKVWFFTDPQLSPGDYIVPGTAEGTEPTDEACRVRRVQPWTLGANAHHWEVEA